MRPLALRHVDRWSFAFSVASGIVAAFAGGLGYQGIAIAAGCLAAVFPIVGRFSTQRLNRIEASAADARVNAAEFALQDLHQRLQPRRLTPQQSATITQIVSGVPSLKVGGARGVEIWVGVHPGAA